MNHAPRLSSRRLFTWKGRGVACFTLALLLGTLVLFPLPASLAAGRGRDSTGGGSGAAAGSVIAAWGQNGYGQCTVPAPNIGFVDADGGTGHTLSP